MYGIIIDRESNFSFARQLSDGLRSRILRGDIPAGERLPSTREAANNLGIARNVVMDSYEQLVAEGYLTGVTGSGTRVNATVGLAPRPYRRASPIPAAVSGAADIIDFASASGTPELGIFPFARWKQCLAQASATAPLSAYSFADIRGEHPLRAALRDWLFRSRGIECDPGQIFITQGITDALSLVSGFLGRRSRTVVLENPVINSFRRTLTLSGYETHNAPVDAEGLIVSGIPLLPEQSLIVVSPSHQFPTGGILPIARRLELLSRPDIEKCWIFEDDYDGDIRLRGLPVPPIHTLAPDRVFYSGTFNKSLFPAIRTGFVIVPESCVEPFRLFRLGISDWAGSLTARALALFIEQGFLERHLLKSKRLYASRREILAGELSRAFGGSAAIHGNEAGFHCSVLLAQSGDADPVRYWARTEDCGVKVATVARYLARNGTEEDDCPYARHIVLGYGNLGEETIREGVARLHEFCARRL